MLAKITSKNQLTLPKAVIDALGPVEYFDVEVRDGQIVLTPVRIHRGDAVRAKLAALGVTEAGIVDAVRWARSGPSRAAAESPSSYAVPSTESSDAKRKERKKATRRG